MTMGVGVILLIVLLPMAAVVGFVFWLGRRSALRHGGRSRVAATTGAEADMTLMASTPILSAAPSASCDQGGSGGSDPGSCG